MYLACCDVTVHTYSRLWNRHTPLALGLNVLAPKKFVEKNKEIAP
jgi:hypothetical protein